MESENDEKNGYENVKLHPITDDAEEAPDWVKKWAREIVWAAHHFSAGMASRRGTHSEVDDAWVVVFTAAKYDGRWQVHASWFDNDDGTHEASFGATIEEDGSE